ncbi:MAG: hypothetical protein KDK78_06035 [Chlamydiia bacterium]|nr:hypothetical protein [Chlamydiia bacterium]
MLISPSSSVATVDSIEDNTYRLVQELIRMGRFEDAAFLARSLTPTELSSLDCDGNNLLHNNRCTYLEQAVSCKSMEVASALRERMHPQDFAQVAAEMQVIVPDDAWKLLLTPILLTKGAQD